MEQLTLQLPYEEIKKENIANRDYLRKNFSPGKQVYRIPTSSILVREGFNKRVKYEGIEELAESIKENGIKEPLVVDVLSDGRIFIDRGHRRMKAINLLISKGLVIDTVECFINAREVTEQQRIEDIFNSNMFACKLNSVEQSAVVFDLKNNFGEISNEEIGKRLGISRQQVDNLLLLAEADDATKQQILDGDLGITEAIKYIRNLKKAQKQSDQSELNANKNSSAAPQDPKDELADEIKELGNLERQALDIRTSDYNPDDVKDGQPLNLVGNTVANQKEEKPEDDGIKKYDESRDEIKQIQNCIKLADKLEAITNKFDVPEGSKKDVADIVKWMQKDLAEVREWISKNKKQNKSR